MLWINLESSLDFVSSLGDILVCWSAGKNCSLPSNWCYGTLRAYCNFSCSAASAWNQVLGIRPYYCGQRGEHSFPALHPRLTQEFKLVFIFIPTTVVSDHFWTDDNFTGSIGFKWLNPFTLIVWSQRRLTCYYCSELYYICEVSHSGYTALKAAISFY
jgi:hypothetical protein